jgi:hypothetical protein
MFKIITTKRRGMLVKKGDDLTLEYFISLKIHRGSKLT